MFKDRTEASEKLRKKLEKYRDLSDIVVLAIPRGGVQIGFNIAQYLNAPLDIVVVRKIGAPGNTEYAVGAVDQEGKIFKNPEVKISQDYLTKEAVKEKKEIRRRISEYRGKTKELDLKNKVVILVDDGIATGLTTSKSIDYIKSKKPKRVILAIPVIPKDVVKKIKRHVDELIFLEEPELFFAVGQFYHYFPQVPDSEVKEILSNIHKKSL